MDNYAAIADDPGTTLARAIIFSGLGMNWQTPDSVIRRALEVSESVGPFVLFRAREAVRVGQWPIARRRVLQVFEKATCSTGAPLATLLLKEFAQTCVQSGLANEAAELLKEAGIDERLLPLYEALRTAAAGPGASLAHLAPEVRVPAEDLLRFLLEPALPPKSSAVKDKRGRARRGEPQNKRAGKGS